MTVAPLFPGQWPNVAGAIPATPRKPDRDFARHVAHREEAQASRARLEESREPAPDPVLASEKALTTKAAITPLAEITSGSVVYPQSLRVVGYLSMLARSDDSAHAAEANVAGTSADDTTPTNTPVLGAVSGTQVPMQTVGAGSPAPVSGPGSRVATENGDAAPAAEVFAAAAPEGRRFARRFVRLNGSTLLLRDFSLSPDRARAVLDAFRTLAAIDGRPLTQATINGKSYSPNKEDNHVG